MAKRKTEQTGEQAVELKPQNGEVRKRPTVRIEMRSGDGALIDALEMSNTPNALLTLAFLRKHFGTVGEATYTYKASVSKILEL